MFYLLILVGVEHRAKSSKRSLGIRVLIRERDFDIERESIPIDVR